LPCKLILVIDERDRQVAAFTEVDRTLKKDLRKKWQQQIDAWLEDKSRPNPYVMEASKDSQLFDVHENAGRY
jgi:hypothetical protein